jgi:pimeloyl-ACP methyl ester carboxylesterase
LKFPLSDHRLTLDDLDLFYRRGGEGSTVTPILLLHGWGISTDPYREVLELLAGERPLLAPDLPGFARSSYPRPLAEYRDYARFLLSFLDALALEQVHLLGQSFGGGVAIALASLAPDRVKSLILVDSTGIPVDSPPTLPPRRAIEMVAQLFLPRSGLKLLDIPLVFSSNLLFNTGNVFQALRLSLLGDLEPLLPTVRSPCLLLWSRKDLTAPLTTARRMADAIPNARLVIVEEGYHEWGLWYPEKMTSLALEFIDRVEGLQE